MFICRENSGDYTSYKHYYYYQIQSVIYHQLKYEVLSDGVRCCRNVLASTLYDFKSVRYISIMILVSPCVHTFITI